MSMSTTAGMQLRARSETKQTGGGQEEGSMFPYRVVRGGLACLLVGLFAGQGMNAMAGNAESESQLPLRKLTVVLGKTGHEALFAHLRKFADKHGFAIRIAPNTATGGDFSIAMWRSDFKILGANPFEPGTFKIGIYDNDAEGVPKEYLNMLFADLKTCLGQIRTATVTEQP